MGIYVPVYKFSMQLIIMLYNFEGVDTGLDTRPLFTNGNSKYDY